MKHRIGKSTFTLMMLLTLSLPLSLGQGLSQGTQPAKKSFAVRAYHGPVACHPVEVKAVSIGEQPPEVLTAQVNIESFSAKPVTAVKLAWNVYRLNEGLRKRDSGCEDNPQSAETLLSGSTPLIQLGQLAEKETCNIGINPLPFKYPATKTVFVEQPIIAWDQVKSLTTDGTRNTFKDDYVLVMYISEISFADGTKWTGEIK